MLKEMKKGFGLLKYGYNVKTNIVCGILFMVLGLIMAFLLPDSFCLGSVYVLLGMLMCIQLQQTLLFSEMISASGKHRFLDVDFPSIVSGIISIGGYVFLSILRILAGVIYPEQKAACGEDLISLGIMAAVLMIYFGICYKIFVVGSVLFAVSFAQIPTSFLRNFLRGFRKRRAVLSVRS